MLEYIRRRRKLFFRVLRTFIAFVIVWLITRYFVLPEFFQLAFAPVEELGLIGRLGMFALRCCESFSSMFAMYRSLLEFAIALLEFLTGEGDE